MSKPYKKINKANKKKKVMHESETGEIVKFNSGKRFPIVSLPAITTNHLLSEYRRFINNGGAVSGNLTIYSIMNQFMFSVTAILLYSYVVAVRIKKIRILSPVTSQGTSVTLSLRPNGQDTSRNNFNAVPELYVDTSASIDVPAYLALTPSLDTPLGSWHQSFNVDGQLCQVVAPAGSTMDILFEYILATEAPPSYTRVVAGATVGQLYSGTLVTNFTPVGRVSI